MFTSLTTDELKSLMNALITRDGFNSNKMCRMLATSSDHRLLDRYSAVANEITGLHVEVAEALVASYGVAA